jgi:hypothetical protein
VRIPDWAIVAYREACSRAATRDVAQVRDGSSNDGDLVRDVGARTAKHLRRNPADAPSPQFRSNAGSNLVHTELFDAGADNAGDAR